MKKLKSRNTLEVENDVFRMRVDRLEHFIGESAHNSDIREREMTLLLSKYINAVRDNINLKAQLEIALSVKTENK